MIDRKDDTRQPVPSRRRRSASGPQTVRVTADHAAIYAAVLLAIR